MATTNDTHPVTRTLKVTEMVCPECDAIVADGLSALDGVQKVEADWKKNSVTVTYDLLKVRAQAVEKLLAEIGYPPDPGCFRRKKRSLLHFTGQNEADNLKHGGHCCSKPPVGA
mgnify:CR=1 FL=1